MAVPHPQKPYLVSETVDDALKAAEPFVVHRVVYFTPSESPRDHGSHHERVAAESEVSAENQSIQSVMHSASILTTQSNS